MRWACFLFFCLAAPACLAQPAGQTVIHHCVDTHGNPVFTDQPCASVDAASVAALASDRPRAHLGCSVTIEALKQRVADAFHRRDANALAGLMLWHGYSASVASTVVQRLAQLMQTPFLGFVDSTSATTGPTTVSTDPRGRRSLPLSGGSVPLRTPTTLTLEVGSIARPHVSFAVQPRDGCLWLEPRPLQSAGP